MRHQDSVVFVSFVFPLHCSFLLPRRLHILICVGLVPTECFCLLCGCGLIFGLCLVVPIIDACLCGYLRCRRVITFFVFGYRCSIVICGCCSGSLNVDHYYRLVMSCCHVCFPSGVLAVLAGALDLLVTVFFARFTCYGIYAVLCVV